MPFFNLIECGMVQNQIKCGITIRRSMQTGYIDGKKIEELTTPKTSNSYRAIPFFDETEECFIKWKEKQDYYKKKLGDKWRAKPEFGNLVFTNTKGSPVTRHVIIHDLKKSLTILIRKKSEKPIGRIESQGYSNT